MNEIEKYMKKNFESIKHIDEHGKEFWFARELQEAFGYKEWKNFKNMINKSITAVKNSNVSVNNNFIEIDRWVQNKKDKTITIDDYMLSRYACYLIIQNGDPKKEPIALGKTYIAIQTRKRELKEKENNIFNI